MKALAIVGFKNSGKTGVTGKLADALEQMGLKVAIVKHTHHNLDKPDSDTGRLRKPGRTIIGLGPDESALFYGEAVPLLKLLPLLKADIALVEGGKEAGWLPRILCLRDPETVEPEKIEPATVEEEAEALSGGNGRGRTLATLRHAPQSPAFSEVPHFATMVTDEGLHIDKLEELARLVWEKSFALPGLNCGACGLGACEAFACAIVQGRAKPEDCPSLHLQAVEIYSDDRALALNPFMGRLIGSMMKAVAAELKGYKPGADLVIRLNSLE